MGKPCPRFRTLPVEAIFSRQSGVVGWRRDTNLFDARSMRWVGSFGVTQYSVVVAVTLGGSEAVGTPVRRCARSVTTGILAPYPPPRLRPLRHPPRHRRPPHHRRPPRHRHLRLRHHPVLDGRRSRGLSGSPADWMPAPPRGVDGKGRDGVQQVRCSPSRTMRAWTTTVPHPYSRRCVRHEVARVEWIHRLEVDDVDGVARACARWPVPSLTCVAGNGGVRSSGDQAQGLLFHPAATGEGEDRTGEYQ